MGEQSPSRLVSGDDEVVVAAGQIREAYEANIETWLIGSPKVATRADGEDSSTIGVITVMNIMKREM